MKAYRQSRDIVPLILNLDTRRGHFHAPAVLYPEKNHGIAGWGGLAPELSRRF